MTSLLPAALHGGEAEMYWALLLGTDDRMGIAQSWVGSGWVLGKVYLL